MNLFDTLNEALNDEVVSKIAKLSDEEPERTKKALDGIFYTLVAGLVRRTGSMMSVSMLYNQVKKGNQGGELIGDIMPYLNKKDKLDAILKVGDGLVSQIFPAYKSPLVSMIGTYAGIKKNSSTMYSSLAAPILIDAVSKEIDTNKLDIDGLIAFLGDHHEPLFKKAPEELLEKMIPQLGLQELQSAKFSSVKKNISAKLISIKGKSIVNDEAAVSDTEDEEISNRSPLPMKLILGAVLAVAIVAGGIYWYKNFYEPSQNIIPIEDAILPAIDSSSILQKDSMVIDSAAIKIKADSIKNATPSLTSNEQFSSFGEELNTYLSDKAKPNGQVFPIANVAFVRGSQALDSESDLIIAELADLMSKYPKMQIQLQGHSNDAVGTDNKSMATKRAFSIKKKLLTKGIVDTRIDAIGTTGTGNGADVKIVSK
jgi:outer membrane protein OmpA-like peptidoglycan-associated protein